MNLDAMSTTFKAVMGAAAKQLGAAAEHEHQALQLLPDGARTISNAAFNPIADGLAAGQGALKLVDEAIKLPVGRDSLQVAMSARSTIKQGLAEIIGLDRDNLAGGLTAAGGHFGHAGDLLRGLS